MSLKILIISGPSAVGKSRVIREILKLDKKFKRLLSCTTREKREEEKDGIDYYFLTKQEYAIAQKNNEFWEDTKKPWGNYGIRKKDIFSITDHGNILITDLDLNGFLKFKTEYGNECIGIFLMPNNLEELYSQLRTRGVNRGIRNEDDFLKRWNENLEVIETRYQYDYILVNDIVHQTANEIINKCYEKD